MKRIPLDRYPSAIFVALEGVDGAGKTTLAQEVTRRLRHRGLTFVPRKMTSAHSEYAGRLMSLMGRMLWESGDSSDLSSDFWMHLQAAWFTAHSEQVVLPLMREGKSILVDGWIYKLWSRLLRQGHEAERLSEVFSNIAVPQCTILLDVPVEVIWKRKRSFQDRELGLHCGHTELGKDSFLEYQAQGAQELRCMASSRNWKTLSIHEDESVDESAQRLQFVVERALDAGADRDRFLTA